MVSGYGCWVTMRRLIARPGRGPDVGSAVGLGGEQADHQREAHIIPPRTLSRNTW
jgi:hypothetical protein